MLALVLPILVGCKPRPEFYINGKPYRTQIVCKQSHVENRFDYHWGYSVIEMRYCWHLGHHVEHVCDRYVVDTIEIKF